jgi:large subunit ribosomal protein L7/L12
MGKAKIKKINIIIKELKKITLIELKNLIKEIENVFNIDTSIPLIPIPSYTINPLISPNLDVNQKEPKKEEEKISFNIVLTEVPTQSRIPILKIVRNITGLGLKESKEIIDNVPKTLKEGIDKEECDRLKKELETVGAKISIN